MPAATAPPPPPSSTVAYLGACAIFVSAGPMLILLNNQLLHQFQFPFPIALSALGVFFSAVASRMLLTLGVI